MNRKSLSFLFLMGLAAGCAQSSHKSTVPEMTDSSGDVIVRVVGSNETITAYTSAHGPIYAVHNNDGRQVSPPMTLQQMQAQNPDLARKVNTMNASSSHTAWAGVD